jgi:hypothetical protein
LAGALDWVYSEDQVPDTLRILTILCVTTKFYAEIFFSERENKSTFQLLLLSSPVLIFVSQSFHTHTQNHLDKGRGGAWLCGNTRTI